MSDLLMLLLFAQRDPADDQLVVPMKQVLLRGMHLKETSLLP
jgi:hypothetical protein